MNEDKVHSTTPSGETGVDDLRDPIEHRGEGHVRDAAGVTAPSEGHAPPADLDDFPSADDPFGTPMHGTKPDRQSPSYERGQGTQDPDIGGSTDPHNFLTHANSGNETESKERNMNEVDNQNRTQQQAVDGFTDTEGQTNVDAPDRGFEGEQKPLSADEYAKAKKEIRNEDDERP